MLKFSWDQRWLLVWNRILQLQRILLLVPITNCTVKEINSICNKLCVVLFCLITNNCGDEITCANFFKYEIIVLACLKYLVEL
jgi:hypothetical protein